MHRFAFTIFKKEKKKKNFFIEFLLDFYGRGTN